MSSKKADCVLGKALAGEDLEQVAEVVPAVKSNPTNAVTQHNPRRRQKFTELDGTNSLLIVLSAVNSAPI